MNTNQCQGGGSAGQESWIPPLTLSFPAQTAQKLFHLGRRLGSDLSLTTGQVLDLVILDIGQRLDHELGSGAEEWAHG